MEEVSNSTVCTPPEVILPTQSFLDSIIDQSPYPMWISDVKGTLIKINKACTDLLHITECEVVGIYNIFDDSIIEKQGLMTLVRRVFDAGESVNFELRYDSSQLKNLQLKQHAFAILDVTIFPIKDSSQKITHAVIQHIDITTRKQAEEELQKSHARLEKRVQERTTELLATNAALLDKISELKLLETELRKKEERFSTAFRVSPDAINITRLSDGMYREISDGFTSITGFTSEDVIDRTSLDLNIWVNPEDRDRLARGLKDHGIVNNLEAQFKHKDGSTLTGLMSARIIELESEPCILSITRDISELKRVEEALRESEAHYRLLTESISDVVWKLDCDYRFTYISPADEKLRGYKAEEVIGHHVFELFDEEGISSLKKAAQKRLEAEKQGDLTCISTFEARHRCKDGSWLWAEINSTPERDAHGAIIGYHGVSRDITERKEHEKERLKIDKLQSLGILAGGIAHDFNNILTVIMGNISFAQMFLDPTNTAYKPLVEAEKASVRASELAHQLLTFARGGDPVKKVVSLQHLVTESVSLVLHGSNISCNIDIPDSIHAFEADEGQMSQVFNNLIINAMQAMAEGGKLTIAARNEILTSNNAIMLPSGTYIRVTFADQGCGIPDDDLKKIFDPYFTTKFSGNGLGLASVYSIVNRHEGHIGVSSVTGEGTSFTIHLPSIGGTYSKYTNSTAPQKDGHHVGGSILVMDDEETIRNMTTEMCEYLGHQATACENGQKAIALYKTAWESGTPYSAVIMDLTIPGSTGGKEAAQQILSFDPEACLIVSSGYSNDPVMSDYRSHGFKCALTKPYNIVQFEQLLRAVLSE
ncbi:MAG: PAS domain S-box protein [Desulfuromonadaceae bacterium]|nr:PAS domain S-box protein [Desulfuromonadaceae bacterium]